MSDLLNQLRGDEALRTRPLLSASFNHSRFNHLTSSHERCYHFVTDPPSDCFFRQETMLS